MLKSFRARLIFRLSVLLATFIIFAWLAVVAGYYVSLVIVAVLIIVQVYGLFRYIMQTNHKLTRFMNAIEYSDFTGSVKNEFNDLGFGDLNKAFREVSDRFNEERREKQQSIRYLETVVQHIGIGLMCVEDSGKVVLFNTASKKLFGLPALRHMNELKNACPELHLHITNLKGGGRNLIRVELDGELKQLAVFATEFRMRDKSYKLVSLQNIHSELEEKEMEAWQNLTRVLAHEIMNSITPIASLSETVKTLLPAPSDLTDETIELSAEAIGDVQEALETIGSRSQGLMRFVNSYRDFTQIPEPDFKLISVREMLQRVVKLMSPMAAAEGIVLRHRTDPGSLELTADPDLVEMILINLVKNAIRALRADSTEGLIEIEGYLGGNGRAWIAVRDNGPGIRSSVAEKVFIPFYTINTSGNNTEKGTGIGLSLSRQIMRMHKGALTLKTSEGRGSVFTLRF